MRERVGAGAVELLQKCRVSLKRSSELLLGVIFSLALDDVAAVASPCRHWLAQARAASALDKSFIQQVPLQSLQHILASS